MVKCPSVHVKLLGQNGNAFMILGSVIKAMRRASVDDSVIETYKAEAMKGDYDHLLRTTMQYMEVE